MFAYSPNKTKIDRVKQQLSGVSHVDEEAFDPSKLNTCEDHFSYQGTTDVDWDNQKDVYEFGERIFVDEDGMDFPESCLVYLPIDSDHPDMEDPESSIAELFVASKAAYESWLARKDNRTYVLNPPEGGWRSITTFSKEEKKLLRPIAETLAMLSGNAFFGLVTDADDDDLVYEEYLPQAAALYLTAGDRASHTSIAKQSASRR